MNTIKQEPKLRSLAFWMTIAIIGVLIPPVMIFGYWSVDKSVEQSDQVFDK